MAELGRDREAALIETALAARHKAYAPYSGFDVGCGLLVDGRVYAGANIENASYGLCLCAERTALAAAVMDGARVLEAVVVASQSSPPAAPCGMCRQALAEFSPDPGAVRVVLVNVHGDRLDRSLAELLPDAFSRHQLTPHAGEHEG
ncbi:cytidine deaminase [Haliangium sp.]|uniref:cytidine deaminase n=1 Tax=Haliangium sp. TaxID=2663208 RepID=UPI003D0B1D90